MFKDSFLKIGNEKILITGSSGFVGKNLCNFFDDLNISYWRYSREIDKNHMNEVSFEEISLNEFDIIIHLAGRAHVTNESSKNPFLEFYDSNVKLTSDLLHKAAASNVKRFIFISSVGVYGIISSDKCISEDNVLNPLEEYAKSKYICENLVIDFCRAHQIEYVILRPPLMYGDNAPGNLRRLFNLCKINLPLPFKNNKSHRSMLDVGSFCDAIYKCAANQAAANKIYNVADDCAVTTSELITCFKTIARKNDLQFFFPKFFVFVFFKLINKTKLYYQLYGSFYLDNKKIKDDLDWKPVSDPKLILSKLKMD